MIQSKHIYIMDVSILLICKEDRGYLDEARVSALNQKFNGTFEVIEQHADLSTAENINAGMKRCTGKWIKWLADDDYLAEGCIQSMYDYGEKHSIDLVYANVIHFNGTTETQFKPRKFRTIQDFAERNPISGGGVLYRRSVLEKLGCLDERLKYGEEWDLNMRIADAGYKFGYLDKFVYNYRVHGEMKSMQGEIKDGFAYIIRKRYLRDTIYMKYINNRKIIVQ